MSCYTEFHGEGTEIHICPRYAGEFFAGSLERRIRKLLSCFTLVLGNGRVSTGWIHGVTLCSTSCYIVFLKKKVRKFHNVYHEVSQCVSQWLKWFLQDILLCDTLCWLRVTLCPDKKFKKLHNVYHEVTQCTSRSYTMCITKFYNTILIWTSI